MFGLMCAGVCVESICSFVGADDWTMSIAVCQIISLVVFFLKLEPALIELFAVGGGVIVFYLRYHKTLVTRGQNVTAKF